VTVGSCCGRMRVVNNLVEFVVRSYCSYRLLAIEPSGSWSDNLGLRQWAWCIRGLARCFVLRVAAYLESRSRHQNAELRASPVVTPPVWYLGWWVCHFKDFGLR
jgi:hypothetical protein